jgi:hypothetical protein
MIYRRNPVRFYKKSILTAVPERDRFDRRSDRSYPRYQLIRAGIVRAGRPHGTGTCYCVRQAVAVCS